jgi:radical SAM-linked protein
MTAEAARKSHSPPLVRLRAAVEYAIDGDLRFLSHHDELRMLTRALVRSSWPLAYSHGFNPQPTLSIPLPRRTGIAAVRQLAIVELTAQRPAHELFESLSSALPAAVPLVAVTVPLGSGTPHATRAAFEIPLDEADLPQLDARIAAALAAKTLRIERNSGPGKPLRSLDIRPFLESMTREGALLRMALTFDGQISARPAEVLTILDLDAGRYECCARRIEVAWDMPIAVRELRSGEQERKNLGQEENHARDAGADEAACA